jgi:hypothetical protein
VAAISTRAAVALIATLPPDQAEVVLLRAAAGPPCPDELAGQPAALATFRRVRHCARGRARLVTVTLAGTLAIGGLWIADGAQSPPGLLSPSGAPAAAGRGQARPLPPRGRVGPGRVGPGRQRRCGRRCRRSWRRRGRAAVGRRGCPRPVSGRSHAMVVAAPPAAGGSASGIRPATSAREPAANPTKPSKAKPGKP